MYKKRFSVIVFVAIAFFTSVPSLFAGEPVEGLRKLTISGANSTLTDRLHFARKLAADKSWPDAIDAYQRLLSQAGDGLVSVATAADKAATSQRVVQLRRVLHQDIAVWPAAATRLYRRRVADWTKRRLDLGLKNRDRELLSGIAGEAFCSAAAATALDALGDLAFERGEFAEALQWWGMLDKGKREKEKGKRNAKTLGDYLLRFPGGPAEIANVRAKMIFALFFSGDIHAARAEYQSFKKLHGKSVGHLAGRKGRYVDILGEWLAKGPPDFGRDKEWPTFGGAANRNASASKLPHPRLWVDGPAWRVSLPGANRAKLQSAPIAARGLAHSSMSPQFHPIIVDNRVLLTDGRNVLLSDLITGKLLGLYSPPIAEFPPHKNGRQNAVRFHMSAANGYVYSILGSRRFTPLEDGNRIAQSNHLICLRIAGNEKHRLEKVWQTKSAADKAEAQLFQGAPVVNGPRIFAVQTAAKGFTVRASLLCFHARTGTKLWQTPIAEWEEEENNSEVIDEPALTLAGNQLIYCSQQGLIAAVDYRTGKRTWALRYVRRGPITIEGLPSPRALAPCLYDNGRLYAAPMDSDRILCIDPETGLTVWERDRIQVVHLLVCRRGKLIFTTRKGIRAVDAKTGLDQGGWQQPSVGRLPPLGRGFVAGGWIFWPTQHPTLPIRTIHAESGTQQHKGVYFTPHRVRKIAAGNMAYASGCLVVATEKELIGYVAARQLLKKRQEDAAGSKPSPLAIYRLAQSQADAGIIDKALSTFKRAERACSKEDWEQELLAWRCMKCRHDLLLEAADSVAAASSRREKAAHQLRGGWKPPLRGRAVAYSSPLSNQQQFLEYGDSSPLSNRQTYLECGDSSPLSNRQANLRDDTASANNRWQLTVLGKDRQRKATASSHESGDESPHSKVAATTPRRGQTTKPRATPWVHPAACDSFERQRRERILRRRHVECSRFRQKTGKAKTRVLANAATIPQSKSFTALPFRAGSFFPLSIPGRCPGLCCSVLSGQDEKPPITAEIRKAVEYLEQAAADEFCDRLRVRAIKSLAELWQRQKQFEKAIVTWQRILDQNSLCRVSLTIDDNLVPAKSLAKKEIWELLNSKGRILYASLEKKAIQLRATAVGERKQSVIAELIERFPHAIATYKTHSSLARTLEAEKQYGKAGEHYGKQARFLVNSHVPDELFGDLGYCVMKIAQMLEAQGLWRDAKEMWQFLEIQIVWGNALHPIQKKSYKQIAKERLADPGFRKFSKGNVYNSPILARELVSHWKSPVAGRLLLPQENAFLSDTGHLFCCKKNQLSCCNAASGQMCWSRELPFIPSCVFVCRNRVLVAGLNGIASLGMADGSLHYAWSTSPKVNANKVFALRAETGVLSHVKLQGFMFADSHCFFILNCNRLFSVYPWSEELDFVIRCPGSRLGGLHSDVEFIPRFGRYHSSYWMEKPTKTIPLTKTLFLQSSDGRVHAVQDKKARSFFATQQPWRQPPIPLKGFRICLAKNADEIQALELDTKIKTAWTHTPRVPTTLTGELPRIFAHSDYLLFLIPRNYGYDLERIDPKTGKNLWKPAARLCRFAFDRKSIAFDKNNAYCISGNVMYCRAMDDGKLVWKKQLPKSLTGWRVRGTKQALIIYNAPAPERKWMSLPIGNYTVTLPLRFLPNRRHAADLRGRSPFRPTLTLPGDDGGIQSVPLDLPKHFAFPFELRVHDPKTGKLLQRMDFGWGNDGGRVQVFRDMLVVEVGGQAWGVRGKNH